MTSSFKWSHLKQFSFFQTFLAFALPSAFAFTGFRVILPMLVANGQPKILMWGIIALLMLIVLSCIGLFVNNKEAKIYNLSLKERLLIKKITLKQWIICIGILIAGLVLSSVLAKTVNFFTTIPGLAIPDYMPFWLNPSVDPMNTEMEILSPAYPLQGNYTVFVIMIFTLLFNIFAEEIYFRAWLLPKMQGFGKGGWILNALLFALYHTFQLWLFPMLFVVSIATTLSVQISKSILPAFVIHIIANFVLAILGVAMLIFA